MTNAFVTAIEARIAFENDKNAANTSMQKTLADMSKIAANDKIAEILVASNVDANFINRAERSNARFNVYAAEKVFNIARNLANVAALNHYTRAIIATCKALEDASLQMTHKDAVCACSQDVKHTDKTREAILRKTRYAKHISANTASTQASSSINALQVFNVLRETRDANNNAVFALNYENETTKKLIEAIAQ